MQLSALTHAGLIVIMVIITALMKMYTTHEGSTPEEKYHKIMGERFIAGLATDPTVYKLSSGLHFRILDKGLGTQLAGVDTPLEIHYEAAYINGTVFDSTYERGAPLELTPAQGHAGWLQALQIMREGDKWELFVPDTLAYGPRRVGVIPPYSTLVYKLEVVKLLNTAKAKAVELADKRVFVPLFGRPYELL